LIRQDRIDRIDRALYGIDVPSSTLLRFSILEYISSCICFPGRPISRNVLRIFHKFLFLCSTYVLIMMRVKLLLSGVIYFLVSSHLIPMDFALLMHNMIRLR